MSEARQLYKRLLRMAQVLEPAARQTHAELQIRTGFRQGRTARESEVEGLLEEGRRALKAGRVLVPRSKLPAMERGEQTVRMVLRDGHVIGGSARGRGGTAGGDSRISDSDMAYHQRLLRRQHFLEKPPQWTPRR